MKKPNDLLGKINVLIVDDMESIRGIIKACVSNLGVKKVFTSFNGEEAWKVIQEQKIHMIICDWDMPKKSGIELLKLVRSEKASEHIPFLMLTASTDNTRVLEAVHNGVSDYLSKPIQPKELDFRVIKLLRKVVLNPETTNLETKKPEKPLNN